MWIWYLTALGLALVAGDALYWYIRRKRMSSEPYKAGEKSRAICSFCNSIQITTFTERTVLLRLGNEMVPNLLVAVCDNCNKVVGIPQQSVPRIQEIMETKTYERI